MSLFGVMAYELSGAATSLDYQNITDNQGEQKQEEYPKIEYSWYHNGYIQVNTNGLVWMGK